MQRLEVATEVRADPETVYEFLLDFPGYARYSEYLEAVTEHGEGGPGTEYDMRVSWWRLSHTARSRVTDVERPERIDWELVGHLDAAGAWAVTPRDGGSASRVELIVEYDPSSADASTLGLPRLLTVDALVDRVRPLLREEAERVVERVVADLEGERRPVDLEIYHGRDAATPDDV